MISPLGDSVVAVELEPGWFSEECGGVLKTVLLDMASSE